MLRGAGVLLFLPVPLVLWLFTQMPWGGWVSVGAGVAIMLTHRLYARPWALEQAGRRCLWCGGTRSPVETVEVVDPFGAVTWAACSASHATAARAFLGFVARHARPLKLGILGAVAFLVLLGPPASSGWLSGLTHRDVVNVFRLSVAGSVLPLGFLAAHGPRPPGPLRVPFPTHLQALVGTRAVTWLFRVVGAAWLVLATRALLARL